jgi:hypothetical protein
VLSLEDFQRTRVRPVQVRLAELGGELAEAEADLESLFRVSGNYDDDAARAVELRLEELRRTLARFTRRRSFLASLENAQSGGRVPLGAP